MTDADRTWAGSMPEIYDRCLGEALFAPPAADLAQRAAAIGPSRVLELAAGTGVLTRALVDALPGAEITATDLNQAMVDHGAARIPQARWQQADAMQLPFEDDSFDLVVCQFGVMFFPDKPVAYAEAARVLAPGGRFLFNAWERLELNDLAALLVDSVEDVLPGGVPNFLAAVPYGYHDPAVITADLAAADLRVEDLTTVTLSGSGTSAAEVAEGFCQGTPLRARLEAVGSLAEVTAQVAAALTATLGSGPVSGRLTAHVVTATADD